MSDETIHKIKRVLVIQHGDQIEPRSSNQRLRPMAWYDVLSVTFSRITIMLS